MKIESLQEVAISVAEERSVEIVLKRIVQGLAGQPGVALSRVWLTGPGDICENCRLLSECPDRTRCLHLAGGAGEPVASPGEDWSRLDGDFCRFPLGVRKVGVIGATGSPVLIKDVSKESQWIARPDWAQREEIQSFAGQPLIFRGEILGVLVVFSRRRLDDREFAWLRTFADHAAVAIANGRAFAEVERLKEKLKLENSYLREEVLGSESTEEIVGQSPALRKVLEQVDLVAPTGANVLVLGDSGTGKELVAHRIHKRSLRGPKPFIKVNCASIPRELFESEFFGHVKGAFTGALRDRPGRFQAADGGTLFLDEVGEIPLDSQSKLLRVLQEGQFERVGEDVTRRVDVRIVAATNRDLEEDVASGRFRQDLYYRLSVFPIDVPALRKRPEDIPLLAEHFIRLLSRRLKIPTLRLTRAQIRLLEEYDWPGNVRELENVIERAAIVARGGPLRLDAALRDLRREPKHRTATEPDPASNPGVLSENQRKRRDRENVEAALKQSGGKIYGSGGAAELLGIKPTTLVSRIKALGIRKQP